VLGLIATLWLKGISVQTLHLAVPEVHEVVLMGVVIAGGMTTLLSRTRLAAMAAIGMVGMPISLYFALMRAPDLALTQLVVEVVTAVLFLLVFAHLPQLKVYPRTPGFQDLNAVVSIGVGVVAALFTLLGNSHRYFSFEIAEYYNRYSAELGGGNNVVNVTLVDFRGFDTMGEITVLAVAGVAIFAMIKLRQPKGGSQK
jgi:multicomponent Na+:H+ antiporter subunit A